MSKIKIQREIERKNFSFEIKDIDPQTRRVKVALSRFDIMDSDRDIIRKGAFLKSIQERGPESTSNRKIAFLRHHDWEHPVGIWKSLEETNEYLLGVGQLGRSTKGTDALLDYQDGIIREHSIGFNYIVDKMKFIEISDQEFYWEVNEVKLWEGSAVTFGAQEDTPTLDVSKGQRRELINKVNDEMTRLIGAMKNGKGTDERLFEIEMRLKTIKDKYNSLIAMEPFEKNTPKQAEPSSSDFKNFLLNI